MIATSITNPGEKQADEIIPKIVKVTHAADINISIKILRNS